jgi:hypothetical protein
MQRNAAIPSRRGIFFRPASASGWLIDEDAVSQGVTRRGKSYSLPFRLHPPRGTRDNHHKALKTSKNKKWPSSIKNKGSEI